MKLVELRILILDWRPGALVQSHFHEDRWNIQLQGQKLVSDRAGSRFETHLQQLMALVHAQQGVRHEQVEEMR